MNRFVSMLEIKFQLMLIGPISSSTLSEALLVVVR